LQGKKKDILEYKRLVIKGYPHDLHTPLLIMKPTVALLVEALRYKPEGRGYDWNFSLA